MKVLVIEDNNELLKNIKNYLEEEGYVVSFASNISSASQKLYGYEYDIIILDLMLPDGSGFEFIHTVKDKAPQTGILIISAKHALQDKLEGLNLGADDYLPKPFHMAELNARLKAIFRRRTTQGETLLKFEELYLNPETYQVQVAGVLLDATKKEFDLLHYFIINKNRVLTKQSIAEHLWGDYVDAGDSFDFVYQHIKNLRKKISEAGGGDYIKTIYGAGYRLSL
jgi:DNA-binding response OmpR family regulator